MRVAVTGATGNVGTSLLDALLHDPQVTEVVGIARRRPQLDLPRTRWVAADVAKDDLTETFGGVDAVVHLAWLIQPSRDRATTHAANVDGSRRVFTTSRVRSVLDRSAVAATGAAIIEVDHGAVVVSGVAQ